jgi:hypothetical protein
MISVLICSADNFLLEQIKSNIQRTIGIEHEILYIDNSIERKGICAVYNSLASRAKFPYLCFVHEDILFETNDWGAIIKDIFAKQDSVGVIGVAGSKYKSKALSGWFTGVKEFDCANIIHKYSYGDELICLKPHEDSLIEEAVCIDGVFICCKRSVWAQLKFDEQQLPGFHFYDVDFSMRASRHSTVIVTYQIQIVHITKGGDFGDRWVETAIRYHFNCAGKLPATKLFNYSAKAEMKISKTWLDILKNHSLSWTNRLRWIRIQKMQFEPALYYSVAKFLFYKPLGLNQIHKLFRKVK